ncbi:MAG: ATP-dependent RNA helicase HrpA [Phycisphaeraceae bacterium]|nr:ATP-dependent RNA helicase HrpA [Phycisphaeraceae bacterium]
MESSTSANLNCPPPAPGLLEQCLCRDRPRLKRLWGRIEHRVRRKQPFDRLVDQYRRLLAESQEQLAARRSSVPELNYDPELPITEHRRELVRLITEHPVVVVCGETGSGKSTQLPKLCLEAGRGVAGLIGHTQPRRIAARSVAGRIAQELATPLGAEVGYRIRFTDRTSPRCKIKVMTDGVLLSEIEHDRWLDEYDTLIIDEAHERSLNIDFLLGYLKQIRDDRRDLKIIITSATIDPQRFSDHFDHAPIVEVSGRTYPVEIRYRSLKRDEEDEQDLNQSQGIVEAVDELCRQGPGDILVFLSGEREIREAGEALEHHHAPGGKLEIIPLYARLSIEEQMRIFSPGSARRVVLATNVAETSLTVPGIRYVIDTGLARIGRFSPRAKIQRLPIEGISQASARQRAGRCGRLGPGICIRLYSEDDYEQSDPFTTAEILRTHLAGVILRMKALGLGDPAQFPFVDAPKPANIREGFRTLFELNALDEKGGLTALGRRLADLPVDPRIGRMVLAGEQENCMTEVMIIASALSVQDLRLRPADQASQADQAHRTFADTESDFIWFLKCWEFLHEQQRKLSNRQFRRCCGQNFLSYLRFREWADVHRQLKELLTNRGVRLNETPATPDAIHRALLTGLLAQVGRLSEQRDYVGPEGKRFVIFPGSTLNQTNPKWIMAAELVETSRVFARTVARIQPGWLENLGEHLLKRGYANPRWNGQSGHAMADERITMMGLTIVPRRSVHYGSIDPAESRRLMIEHGLIGGDMRISLPFFTRNQELRAQLERWIPRLRRRDLLADTARQFEFYDRLIPADVCSVPRLKKWWQTLTDEQRRRLTMSDHDLWTAAIPFPNRDDYPDHLELDRLKLPIEYRYDPEHPEDGLTLTVPLLALDRLSGAQLSWLVPGWVCTRAQELMRALPRDYRRHFVPVSHYIEQMRSRLVAGDVSLHAALSRELKRLTGVDVPLRFWDEQALPAWMRFNLKVIDDQGRVIGGGRDLTGLRATLRDRLRHGLAEVAHERFNRSKVTNWDFGELPERLVLDEAGIKLEVYPALVDVQTHASLRLTDDPALSAGLSRRGVLRLFMLHAQRDLAFQHKHIRTELRKWIQQARDNDTRVRLESQATDRIAERAFEGAGPMPRDGKTFEKRCHQAWHRLAEARSEVCQRFNRVLEAEQAARRVLEQPVPEALGPSRDDAAAHLRSLTEGDYLTQLPWTRLEHLPRYLAGIVMRMNRLRAGGGTLNRDRRAMEQISPYVQAFEALTARLPEDKRRLPEIDDFRWMLEELRISLFAQSLGTIMPVSLKRLDQQWSAIRI